MFQIITRNVNSTNTYPSLRHNSCLQMVINIHTGTLKCLLCPYLCCGSPTCIFYSNHTLPRPDTIMVSTLKDPKVASKMKMQIKKHSRDPRPHYLCYTTTFLTSSKLSHYICVTLYKAKDMKNDLLL